MGLFDIFKRTPTIENKDEVKPIKADPYTNFVDYKQAIYRSRQDLASYRNAVLYAENMVTPQRYPLLQIYVNVMIDSHLTAAIQQRKNLTLCKEFKVIDTTGEINEERSELIRKQWFNDFLDLSLDSMFWGYSLIMFDKIVNDEFIGVELVPRQYVKPEFHIVVKNWGDYIGNDYLAPEYKDWTIGVGKPTNLGLLLKAAPLILWKNSALGAWAEYQDNFGSPMRYIQTDIRDEKTRKNAENYMRDWGVNPWAVFDKSDVIKLVETTKQDAHNVFDMMISRVNAEISKLILGQTSTMDEKAFTGSAEVHERVTEAYAEMDEHFICGVLNYQLVPLLISHGILKPGDKIEVAEAEQISVIERSKIAIELIKTGKYKMSLESLQEEFGIEMEEVEQPVDNSQNVQNRLNFYYDK
jgi:hypothetical protein